MKIKKIMAALLVAALTLVLAGCYNPSVVVKSGETEITAGEYLTYQYMAARKLIDSKSADSLYKLLKMDIDGVPAEQAIHEETLSLIKQDLYVKSEIDRLDVKLDSYTEVQAEYYISYYWSNYYATSMQKNGIAYDSYKNVSMKEYQSDLLFNTLYGEGGEFEVPVADLMAYYDQNYAASQVLSMPLADANGTAITADIATKLKEIADEMAAAINAGMGAENAVVEYYPKAQELLGYEPSQYITAAGVAEKLSATTLSADSTGYSSAVISAALAAKIGSASAVQDGNSVFVVVRGKAYTSEETFATLKSTALSGLKLSEYKEYIKSKADAAIELTVDEKAVKYYSISKISGL